MLLQVRVAFGLPAVTSFVDITSDVTVQNQLEANYRTVDQFDGEDFGINDSL
jgi:hypothetical protein